VAAQNIVCSSAFSLGYGGVTALAGHFRIAAAKSDLDNAGLQVYKVN
jgi:hypothetical protein